MKDNVDSDLLKVYTISYQFGTYCGTRRIVAVDEDQAIAKCKRNLSEYMTLSMAYWSMEVIKIEPYVIKD